jgi:hypothetical protein
MTHAVAGLDLGQAADYSALAIMEETADHLDLRHLERWPLRTPYPRIAADVRELLTRPQLRGHTDLIVDGTGVGRPVVDLLNAAGLSPIPVSITGGDNVSHEGGWWSVPKRDLVSSVAVGLETGRLRIAAGLAYGPVLKQELETFRAKISLGGHDSYEAWREQDHDDLVLAVALAAWWAGRGHPNLRFITY